MTKTETIGVNLNGTYDAVSTLDKAMEKWIENHQGVRILCHAVAFDTFITVDLGYDPDEQTDEERSYYNAKKRYTSATSAVISIIFDE